LPSTISRFLSQRGGGFAFADGHSEIKKWLDGNTKRPVLKQPISSGTVAPRDFGWVNERATNR
jgi:prepilin-type processing-associated H-X9-DG protein